MDKSLMILGLILTLIATVFLYLGSRHLPWGVRTWNGKSKKENTFVEARHKDTKVGFILLFFGFLLQLISVLI